MVGGGFVLGRVVGVKGVNEVWGGMNEVLGEKVGGSV